MVRAPNCPTISHRERLAVTQTIAIDPGLDGAIAVLTPTGIIDIIDMPTIGQGRERHIDAHATVTAIIAAGPVEMVILEDASTRPGLASQAVLKTGKGWGVLYGALVALERPVTVVRPQEWKRAVGLPKGADKNASRERAKQLWPTDADRFARRRDDGRAEACLMAEWWHRHPSSRVA